MGTIWMIFSIILWIHLFARIKISFVAPSNNKRHLMYIFTYINQSVPIYWGILWELSMAKVGESCGAIFPNISKVSPGGV